MAVTRPVAPPKAVWPNDYPLDSLDDGSDREPRNFRPDIEGLRAIAVVLVVLYHAHILGVSGGYIGVDVFFVLSGFLITRQLVTNIDRRGFRELPAFYARRIRRLLPASTAVVVTTIVAAHFWAPALQAKSVATDALFTIVYGLNYRLAVNGTDYMHQGDAVSPLQHFWSLGVEEQFYLVWPLIIVTVMLMPRVVRQWALLVVLLGIAAASFHQSATITVTQPAWAYFSLVTRAWELGAGGLIALTANGWARLPKWPANVLAWAGLAMVVASAWLLNDATPYPGVLAAVPVLATAVVVGCGCAPRHHGIEGVLAEPLIQGIGKISYSWYLWHWPFLIIAPMIAGGVLAWPRRAEIVLLSLLIAILSYHILENPIRMLVRPNVHWLRIGAVLGCVVVGVSVVSTNTVQTAGQGAAIQTAVISLDSRALREEAREVLASMKITRAPTNLRPSLAKAADDYPMGCITVVDSVTATTGSCILGDAHARATIGLFGDSHAQQWGSGLDQAAKILHYRVVVRSKAACPAADLKVWNPILKREYRECDAWRPKAIDELIAAHPRFVIMSQADAVPGSSISDETWASATASTVKRFESAGIPVIFFLDTPLIPFDVPSCVADHLDSVDRCGVTRLKMYAHPQRHTAVATASKAAGAEVVDPAEWLCTANGCPPIVGNILAYRDNVGHLTHTLSRWLAPVLVSMVRAHERAIRPGG